VPHSFAVSPNKFCFIIIFCSKVPAFLNVVDIAGLVKGASEGQGLGNAFLSHIKACDAMFHLCRKYF
jgi:ribosome-binding ATPase YchF (GTP1/OBG family)